MRGFADDHGVAVRRGKVRWPGYPLQQAPHDRRRHPNDTQFIETDVAIIGAGPVGLMIANILGLQGVRVTLIEKLGEIIDYPRAIGLDDETLRVFQSVGLADELLPHTTPNHWMRFTLRSQCSTYSIANYLCCFVSSISGEIKRSN